MKKITIEEFLNRAIIIHKNKYDYSKTLYKSSQEKITIICKKHGEFLQRASNHLSGYGCLKCGSLEWNKNLSNVKIQFNEFVKIANIQHCNLYNYKNSSKNYNGMHGNKIEIICNTHGLFYKIPYNHVVNGEGCPKCKGLYRTTKQFINEATVVHGNKYDYSITVYNGSHKKLNVICKSHGAYNIKAIKHLKGQGCKKCNYKEKLTTSEFITRALKIHNNIYDYSLVKYKNIDCNVEIICNIHGVFLQKAYNHLIGHGCLKCTKNHHLTNSEFIDKSNYVHNYLYDYSLCEYKNSTSKVNILCKFHGSFLQAPNKHLRGQGCPSCSYSSGELIIKQYLKNKNINFIEQHIFNDCKYKKPLRFDFYLPYFNMCIEFDGEQHYVDKPFFGQTNNLKIYRIRDNIKNIYCIKHNITLIRIHYKEKNIINNKLDKFLLLN
jgi:hypothetical protein